MKYCSECGNELLDKAEICPRCGCRVSPPQTAGKSSSSNEDLDLITKIFLILGTIALGVFLIPLAWIIFALQESRAPCRAARHSVFVLQHR